MIAGEDTSIYRLKKSPFSSHSLLLEQFPRPQRPERILDLGCGDGYLAALLTERGYDVTGVERREGYSARFPRHVELIEADLEHGLPPLPARYHHVICADILEHLRQPARLLYEIHGVLQPGGRIVASLPNSGNIYFRLNVAFGRFPQHDKGLFDRTHLRFYMWKGWKELFAETRWRIISVRSSGIPIGLIVPRSHENSALVRVAESVSYSLAQIRKTLFAYQFVVVAEPRE
jgi:2-polyprenyl-3-methyl-5-hydroxy-6-metoxy-1,4-benzoquinol methylase